MSGEIVNRVAASPLVTFDLEQYYTPGPRAVVDIKDLLFEGLVLREKDLRLHVESHPWEQYRGAYVAITCSADAVIPTWAYMLLTSALQPHAAKIVTGNLERLEEVLYRDRLDTIDWESFRGRKVVVKGCSGVRVPVSAYAEAMARLRPVAASVMFGEPCSTVPLYKAGKA
jgi:hypothetical protein